MDLITILHPIMEERVSMKGIPLELKVFTALRFYAVGSYQRCIGQDFISGLSQTSTHRCIKSITQALSNLAHQHIQLPLSTQERNAIKLDYMNRWGFPGAIGAIDGTHIAILKPHENEHNFINRKHFHSLNVQIICDPNLKIRSINSNYGGSTHDSFIWNHSEVKDFIENLNERETCWLIGDSGYPQQPFLMTPFQNPQNNAENNYNYAHIRGRNCVERCIGVLKCRFRCLLKERSARYKPQFMADVVKACSFLHNICIEGNLQLNEEIQEDDNNYDDIYPLNNANLEGAAARYRLVDQYFA